MNGKYTSVNNNIWGNFDGTRVLSYMSGGWNGCYSVNYVPDSNCFPFRRWAFISNLATPINNNVNIWAKSGSSSGIVTSCGPCEAIPPLCGSNASCTSVYGHSVLCECNDGFDGDGQTCNDVNECIDARVLANMAFASSSKDTDTCDANAICTNTLGSYTCSCADGFVGDGQTCNDVNECIDARVLASNSSSQDPDTCGENAICTNTLGSYTCSCSEGFTGDGNICIDVDECVSTACGGTEDCVNTLGSRVTEIFNIHARDAMPG